MVTSKNSSNPKKNRKRCILHLTCATFSELPSNISTIETKSGKNRNLENIHLIMNVYVLTNTIFPANIQVSNVCTSITNTYTLIIFQATRPPHGVNIKWKTDTLKCTCLTFLCWLLNRCSFVLRKIWIPVPESSFAKNIINELN